MAKPWTTKEVNMLKQLLQESATFKDIAAVLGRSHCSVRDYVKTHNLSPKKSARHAAGAMLDIATVGKWVSMPCDFTLYEPHTQRRMIQRVAVAKGMQAATRLDGDTIMIMRIK